jgi:hypothetical protein
MRLFVAPSAYTIEMLRESLPNLIGTIPQAPKTIKGEDTLGESGLFGGRLRVTRHVLAVDEIV